jgi:rare lipoprotein A
MKRILSSIVIGLALSALCAAQTQPASETSSFRQEGIASWYGAEFAGRPTASGEIFNPSQLSAAHPTLPFGTLLRITNKHNNKQATVRVNDRGPFVSARIIDVSRAAAEQLDMISTGTAPVLVEALGEVAAAPAALSPVPAPGQTIVVQPGSVQPISAQEAVQAASQNGETAVPLTGVPAQIKPSLPPAGSGKLYRVQVGSYKIARNAVDAFDKLKGAGLNPAYERYGEFYRVVLAGIRADNIQYVAGQLGAAGFREALIREEH